MGMMEHDILKVLYTEEEIKARVRDLGARMYEDLKDKDPLFVSVLRGAFIFMADIVRACQVKCDVEFIAVSSYGNATSSSGAVQITHDIQQDISGRDLVVIEDILDSGNTLNFLKQYFLTKGAASVSICTLLDKPSRRTKAITADYVGFVVPDEFVVGYGLDYCQKYRNLPYIGVLKPEVYSGEGGLVCGGFIPRAPFRFACANEWHRCAEIRVSPGGWERNIFLHRLLPFDSVAPGPPRPGPG